MCCVHLVAQRMQPVTYLSVGGLHSRVGMNGVEVSSNVHPNICFDLRALISFSVLHICCVHLIGKECDQP